MDLKQQHNTPISQGRRQRLPFLYFLKALTFFNISQRLPAKNAVYRPESGRSVRKGRIVNLRIRAKIRTKTAAFSHKRDSFRCVFVKECAPYTQKTSCTGHTPGSRLFCGFSQIPSSAGVFRCFCSGSFSRFSLGSFCFLQRIQHRLHGTNPAPQQLVFYLGSPNRAAGGRALC